ncbi:MAG: fused MFS/spermidine synthase [Candidatus Obscuribacterales bacterium]|nr:fused MFS/spermidine synthase [Candidatus Obscuribacterales bacterium]
MSDTPEAVSASNSISSKFFLVALLFFLSGASSLIYQVIWTRQMVFVFGSSTFASSTVLSAFMGGLALGSFAAGRYADKLKNPFLIYGILEGIIGVWALLAPFMFDAALPIYKSFWQQMHLQVLPFSLLRFIVVSMILLPPTACMGATLPILSRFVTSSLSVVGEKVGTLYSINTLGAVFGAVAGGFWLIPAFGLYASTLTAACVNILLALAVLGLLQLIPAFKETSSSLEKDWQPEPSVQSTAALSKPALFTLIAFGISGAIAMIYEVAWTRALLLVIGSTTYAFSIMLSTFLIGIFQGSFIFSKFADKMKNGVLCFAVLQVVLALAAVVSILLFNMLPYWNLVVNAQQISNPELGMLNRFMLAAVVLFPIALCLGALFPVAVKVCTVELEKLGRSVGTLYSVNTLGAIIGSFACGFLIIPAIGGEKTLVLCAAANALLGLVLLLGCVKEQVLLKAFSAASLLGITLWSLLSPQIWNLHVITSSQKLRRGLNWNKQTTVPPYSDWLAQVNKSFEIEFWKDGLCANVAVVKFPDKQHSLFTNGHIDASDGPTDMPTQVLLPSIPLLLNPKAQTVADVGWGSGCTMGYALLFPIKKMICAEIEPAVVETSRFFHKVNMAPEDDTERLKIEYNDGRNYLLATDETFDLITSEPSNPWQAGVCNLYTKEYFQVCHDRLNKGGIFAMWWQSNEVSSDNLTRVFAALKKVFKHLVVFETYPGDISACASDEPIKINLNAVNEALQNPRLRERLAVFGAIASAEDLPLKVRMTDEAIDNLIKGVEANSDDKNHIEFDVAKTYEQKNYTAENQKWMLKNCGNVFDVVDWSPYTEKEKAEKLAAIAERAMVRNNPFADLWAAESYRTSPNSFALCVRALILSQKKGDFEGAYKYADEAVKRYPGDVKPLCVRGIVAMLGGAPMKARKDFEAALAIEPQNFIYKFRLAQTYMPTFKDWYQIANIPMPDIALANSNPARALELLAPVMKDNNFLSQNPAALATYGAACLQTGRLEEGIISLRNFLKVRIDDILALRLLAEASNKTGDQMAASYCTQRAAELSKAVALRLCQASLGLEKEGQVDYAAGALKRALEYNPASAEARVLLKKLALKNDKALEVMKQLTKFSLEDSDAYNQVLQERAKN